MNRARNSADTKISETNRLSGTLPTEGALRGFRPQITHGEGKSHDCKAFSFVYCTAFGGSRCRGAGGACVRAIPAKLARAARPAGHPADAGATGSTDPASRAKSD